jgi:hypothetical protein
LSLSQAIVAVGHTIFTKDIRRKWTIRAIR